MELDNQSVLRADPQTDGSYTVTRVTFDTTQPNGILVSQDQNTLYVAESSYTQGHRARAARLPDPRGRQPRHLLDAVHLGRGRARACTAASTACASTRDGNIVATNGWEVSGPGPMITVFSPTGRVLETHPVPANRPTNCCFGGPDLTTLFVTTTQGHFFKAQTDRVGWAMYPQDRKIRPPKTPRTASNNQNTKSNRARYCAAIPENLARGTSRHFMLAEIEESGACSSARWRSSATDPACS